MLRECGEDYYLLMHFLNQYNKSPFMKRKYTGRNAILKYNDLDKPVPLLHISQ